MSQFEIAALGSTVLLFLLLQLRKFYSDFFFSFDYTGSVKLGVLGKGI